MKIPLWVTSRLAVYLGGVILVLLGAWLWVSAHDRKIAREAIAERAVAEAQAKLVIAQRDLALKEDSLRIAQVQTNVATGNAQAAGTAYTAQRARIITVPQQGVPAGMVLVPVSFVATADSMMAAMKLLIVQQQLERAAATKRIEAADSVNKIQSTMIAALQTELKAKGGGLQTKIKYAAIGGAIIGTAIAVFKR